MTTTWRIASILTLMSGLLAGSSLLGGCANDVPTPPWLPNYVDSGYGGNAGAGGAGGAGGKGGESSASGGARAGEAGEAGEGNLGGSSGEGGEAP